MIWKVKLTIRLMGKNCHGCKQHYECDVAADDEQSAVAAAKKLSGADPDMHKFSIDLVRKIK